MTFKDVLNLRLMQGDILTVATDIESYHEKISDIVGWDDGIKELSGKEISILYGDLRSCTFIQTPLALIWECVSCEIKDWNHSKLNQIIGQKLAELCTMRNHYGDKVAFLNVKKAMILAYDIFAQGAYSRYWGTSNVLPNYTDLMEIYYSIVRMEIISNGGDKQWMEIIR